MFKQTIIFTFLISIFSLSFGQKVDSMTIETIYTPTLAKASKKNIPMNVIKKPDVKVKLKYDLKPIHLNTPKVSKLIPPVKYKPKQSYAWKSNYIKGGFGLHNTFLGEIYLTNREDAKSRYGVYYKHLSANKSKSYQDFSNNHVGAFGQVMNRYVSLAGEFDYKRDARRFYNYKFNDSFLENRKHITKTFENWHFGTEIKNVPSYRSKFDYKTGFDVNIFNTKNNVRENDFKLDGAMDFLLRYGKIHVGVEGHAIQLTGFAKNNRLLGEVGGYYEYDYNNLRIKVGGKIFTEKDTSAKARLNIYPDILIEKDVLPKTAIFFVGLTGYNEKTTWRTLHNKNPFLDYVPNVKSYSENFKITLGIRGKIKSKSNYQLSAAYGGVSNLPLFVPSGDSINGFGIIYDNATIVQLKAGVKYNVSEKFRLGLDLMYNQFDTKNESESWSIVPLHLRANLHYKIGNKIYTTFETIVYGGQRAMDESNNTQNVKPFADINLNIDYIFKPYLSIFLTANNGLTSPYQRWYGYKQHGLNIMAGVTFSLGKYTSKK